MTIKLFDLYVYLMFTALFKIYFIPSFVRQIIKIATMFFLFIFLTEKLSKKELLNFSLCFAIIIVWSGIWNCFLGDYTIKALLDSFLYALSFYDLYTLFMYANKYQCTKRMIYDLYQINLIYCFFTLVSVFFIGTDNNSNVAAYPFGNKFTSSYLFVSLISLYGISHNMKKEKSKITMCVLLILGLSFSIYVGCATATVSLLLATVIFFFNQKICKNIALNPVIATGILIITSVIPFIIDLILKIDFVNYVIFDVFHRSSTVFGRFEIYKTFLPEMIQNKFWFGYGYSNGKMLQISGVFGNAQNGLLEQMINFGFIGVIIILVTVFYALKKSQKENASYMLILLYAMIIAAIFEVTINWFFWIALFTLQWYTQNKKWRNENEKHRNFINATSR